MISEQDKAITVSKTLLNAKDEAMGTMMEISKQDKIVAKEREKQLNIDISSLKSEIDLIKNSSEIKQRKRFWSGIKIGGVSVAVLGVAGLIWFNYK